MSIVERMISVGSGIDSTNITPQQRTLIDRCVRRCYSKFFEHHFDPAYVPTFKDLQDEFDKERHSEDGRKVAEAVEYYTRGSMSIFANKTNVKIDNRMVVFNVRDLGEQLRQIALTIVFDFIWNRMVENKAKGVRTYCYCDEIHVMFRSYYTADFLQQLYKRGRKYGLCITGITQNVADLISSKQAQGMISNSDYIMMLNQHAEDLKILASMLKISEVQLQYVIGADAGSGLIFAENVIVPFIDRFPSDSYLYKLMSTKFGEDMSVMDIDKKINEIVGLGGIPQRTSNEEENEFENNHVRETIADTAPSNIYNICNEVDPVEITGDIESISDEITPVAATSNIYNIDNEIVPVSVANNNNEARLSIVKGNVDIKNDIDLLIPYVNSYEELISKLRDSGYRISDRKKDGNWMKYILFTPPNAAKGTRDCNIGDGVFYTREVLTEYIASHRALKSS